MKKLIVTLLSLAFLFAIVISSNGQNGIYDKSSVHYSITRSMGVGFYGNKQDGDKTDNTTSSIIDIGGEYFVMDNLAAGLWFYREREADKNSHKDSWCYNKLNLIDFL